MAYVQAQLTSTSLASNANNRISRVTYDDAGRAAFTIGALGAVVELTYDDLNQVTRQVAYAVGYGSAGDKNLGTMTTWAGTQASHPDNRVTRNIYDMAGRLTYVVDGETYITQFDRDEAGRVTRERRYDGKFTVGDSDTKSTVETLLTGVTPGAWVDTDYAYDAAGRVESQTDGVGAVTRFTYDGLGQVTDTTIAYGTGDATTTHRVYDAAGRVTSETGAYGVSGVAATVSYTYDAVGNLLTRTDPRGHATTYTYDNAGRVLTSSIPVNANSDDNLVTIYEYDGLGDLKKVTDARGGTAFSYYNALGQLTLQIDQEHYGTATSYTIFGQVASVTRYAAKTTGTPTLTTPPTIVTGGLDATTSFTYDKCGGVTRVTDAEGYHEDYTLGTFGERLRIDNKAGGYFLYQYDRLGRQFTSIQYVNAYRADGSLQTNAFFESAEAIDSHGNVTWKAQAYFMDEQRISGFAYDKANRLVQAYPDAVTVTASDLSGTSTVAPTPTYWYNLRGELIQSTDAAGAKTLAWYDALGRKTDEVNAVGTLTHWTYDANGNVATMRVYDTAVTIPGSPGGTPPSGAGTYREIGYAYDWANRLITTTTSSLLTGQYDGAEWSTTTGTISGGVAQLDHGGVVRETDGLGNVSWTWLDGLGRKVAQVDKENYLTFWVLDSNGNAKTEIRYATQITDSFDEESTVEDLQDLAGTDAKDRETSFTYDKNGNRRTEARLAVYASTVSSSGVLASASATATITYEYNELGLVTKRTEANGDVTDYTYDNFGRLTSVTGPAYDDQTGTSVQRRTENFHDAFGRVVRTEINKVGGSSGDDRVTMFVYGVGDRLLSTTDAGGSTHEFGYDAAGRVVMDKWTRTLSDGVTEVTEATNYRYDAAGRMILQANASWNGSAWVFGDATRILYNAHGDVIGKGITAAPTDTAVYQETFDYDAGGRLWRTNSGDGTIKLMFYDKAGNATLTLSSVGADLSGYTLATAAALIDDNGGIDINEDGTADIDAVTTIATFDGRGQQLGTIQADRELSSSTTETVTASRTYNAFGEVLSETDGRGYTTEFAYNAMGRLIEKKSPEVAFTAANGADDTARPTETYYFDISGRMVAVSDANNNLTRRLLLAGTGQNGEEPLVAAEFHADLTVARTYYDVFGDLRISRNELYDGTNAVDTDEVYGYDKMGRLTSVQHRGDLLTDNYIYDELGQRTGHWNDYLTDTVVETTDYDRQGRVVSTVTFGGDTTTYSYSWNGALVTDGLGTFGGWVKETENASSLTMTESLDYFGRTIDKEDFGSHDYDFTFDLGGRLVARSNDAGENLTYAWYNSGLIASIVSGFTGDTYYGQTVTSSYEYDEAGNRTRETYEATGHNYDWWDASAYSYTISHQDATATYDALGRILTITDTGASGSAPMSIAYEYDLVGNVRHMAAEYRTLNPQGVIGSTDIPQDYWYSYDSMNRFLVTQGHLSGTAGAGGTTIVGGTAITYDDAGRRETVTTHSDALVWNGYKATYKVDHNLVYYFETEDIDTDNHNYVWLPAELTYSGAVIETYSYNAAGDLTGVSVATQTAYMAPWGSAPTLDAMGSSVQRAAYTRDAMGRVTSQVEYKANGVSTAWSRTASYDAGSRVLGDTVTAYRDDGTFVTTSTYTYGTGSLLSSVSADVSKNGVDANAPDSVTTYDYGWWDSAQQSLVTINPDDSATNKTSTYYRDGSGNLTSVYINDGRPRTVSFVSDANGLILQRDENDNNSSVGDPRELHYYFNGVRVGDIGNNGTSDIDYVSSIAAKTRAGSNTPFMNGTSYGQSFADFDQSYDPINGFSVAGTGSSYTVNDGDTLQTVALAAWGDASLWYLIAQANGMTGAETLISGTVLTIPSKVTNLHNNSGTFKPYDPNQAMGDLSPTAIKPPKKPGTCGVVGAILMVAIAVAVRGHGRRGGGGAFAWHWRDLLRHWCPRSRRDRLCCDGGCGRDWWRSRFDGQPGVRIAAGIQDKFSWRAWPWARSVAP